MRLKSLAAVISATCFAAFIALTLSSQSSATSPAVPPSENDGPTLVYVPGTSGGITEINSANDIVFGTAPWAHGSNGGIVFTGDGSRLYLSNHETSSVSVFDTATNQPLAEISVGLSPLGVAITPDSRYVYVANQDSNTVSVISTTTNTVVQTIPVGLNPIWITISPDGSRAYVSNQYDYTLSVIDIVSNVVVGDIPVGVFPFHSKFATGGRYLWVSAQGDNVVDVVDTNTNNVINTIPAGPNPRAIAFSGDGKQAYVADFFSNTVAVIDVPSQTLNQFITVGYGPWGLAITPSGRLYVSNFWSNTVSVIDSPTNQVIDTVSARTGPADVQITTRAHPLVLAYKFMSIAPSGALYSLTRGLNNRGDAVGDYLDSSFGYHGFLRTHDGTMTSIDPPGAVATSTFAVNDSGVIVGAYRDSLNVLHGFRRSPSGSYMTMDFPGVPDSQLTGINDSGEITGVYDLGSLASTQCPGASCGAISFSLKDGQYTSFEDPAAAPEVTFAQSVNNRGQIAGFYQDPGGGIWGFLRNTDGTFNSIQFPFAGHQSRVAQLNNSGEMAGEFQISFTQGFLAFGSHFLSFDYPNSVFSGLRAVNDRGQVAGYFAFQGGPVEAFIATPNSD